MTSTSSVFHLLSRKRNTRYEMSETRSLPLVYDARNCRLCRNFEYQIYNSHLQRGSTKETKRRRLKSRPANTWTSHMKHALKWWMKHFKHYFSQMNQTVDKKYNYLINMITSIHIYTMYIVYSWNSIFRTAKRSPSWVELKKI